jgi:hypothetical protein
MRKHKLYLHGKIEIHGYGSVAGEDDKAEKMARPTRFVMLGGSINWQRRKSQDVILFLKVLDYDFF